MPSWVWKALIAFAVMMGVLVVVMAASGAVRAWVSHKVLRNRNLEEGLLGVHPEDVYAAGIQNDLNLKEAGFSVQQVHKARVEGRIDATFKEAGFTDPAEVYNVDLEPELTLKDAGFSMQEVHTDIVNGVIDVTLKGAGFTDPAEVYNADLEPELTLRDAGFSMQEVHSAIVNTDSPIDTNLKEEGFTDPAEVYNTDLEPELTLRDAGFEMPEVHSAIVNGVIDVSLKEAGWNSIGTFERVIRNSELAPPLSNLREAGFTVEDLQRYSVTAFDVTQHGFSLADLAGIAEEREGEIRREAAASGRFYDEDFPPTRSSLGINSSPVSTALRQHGLTPDQEVRELTAIWKPLEEVYPWSEAKLWSEDGPRPQSFANQGYIGNCWLISAMNNVCHQSPARIRDMFVVPSNGEVPADGRVVIRLFDPSLPDGGGYVNVEVDTYIPCFHRPTVGHSPIGSSTESRSPCELWMLMVEKAWAKHFGGNLVSEPGLLGPDHPFPTASISIERHRQLGNDFRESLESIAPGIEVPAELSTAWLRDESGNLEKVTLLRRAGVADGLNTDNSTNFIVESNGETSTQPISSLLRRDPSTAYGNLHGGFSHAGIVGLMGPQFVNEPGGTSAQDSDAMFRTLKQISEAGGVVTSERIPGHLQGFHTDRIDRGHAYSIVRFEEVPLLDGGPPETVKLVQIHNPAPNPGRVHWEGAWSDSDHDSWNNVDASVRSGLQGSPYGGEFVWRSWDELVGNQQGTSTEGALVSEALYRDDVRADFEELPNSDDDETWGWFRPFLESVNDSNNIELRWRLNENGYTIYRQTQGGGEQIFKEDLPIDEMSALVNIAGVYSEEHGSILSEGNIAVTPPDSEFARTENTVDLGPGETMTGWMAARGFVPA